jgi:hypothetical protein
MTIISAWLVREATSKVRMTVDFIGISAKITGRRNINIVFFGSIFDLNSWSWRGDAGIPRMISVLLESVGFYAGASASSTSADAPFLSPVLNCGAILIHVVDWCGDARRYFPEYPVV